MRNVIKQISKSNLLSFDIETATQYKELFDNPDIIEVFRYKHRDKVTEELLNDKDINALYNKVGALSPIYGKVISVSFSYLDGNQEIQSKVITGEEVDIITEVNEVFRNNLSRSGFLLIGYNINRFDLPFLRVRTDILGMDFPAFLSDSGKKPWEVGGGKSVDLMELFKGSMYNSFSLEEFCVAFGVPSPKGGIKGSEVSKTFHRGGIKEIAEYNQRDTEALIKVIQKMK